MKTIQLEADDELAAELAARAERWGMTVEEVAVVGLRERFFPHKPPMEPRNEWERRLFSIGHDAGVSIPDEALTAEGIYPD